MQVNSKSLTGENDEKRVFVSAVQNHTGISEVAKTNAEQVIGLEETTFDQTYLDFLDEQIELCTRGPEWNERLKRRRDALAPFCDQELLCGRIKAGGVDFRIKVDPTQQAVVHWEEYEEETSKPNECP